MVENQKNDGLGVIGWPLIVACAFAVLLCSGCVTRVYPISERIIVVPLEPTSRPTTRDSLIDRGPEAKIAGRE